jgi:hypothetical protein
MSDCFCKGIVVWWTCEWKGEPMNKSKKIFHLYSTMSTKTHMSSLPHGFTTWTFDNNVFDQSNINIEFYQGWCPMCWSKEMFLAHFFRILPLGFKHVQRGKLFFDIKSIFYITSKIFKYSATSFMAIIMGDKLNITKTWTCQQNKNDRYSRVTYNNYLYNTKIF